MVRYLYIIILLALQLPAHAQLSVADGLYNQQDRDRLGLDTIAGMRTTTIFRPTDADTHYNNGCAVTRWRNRLYVMWQTSPTDEDTPDTRTLYAYSSDDGQTWSKPLVLSPTDDKGYYTTAGWITEGDSLVALLAYWPHAEKPRGGYTRYRTTRNGQYWSSVKSVTTSTGEPLRGVMEQDLRRLPSGRWVGAAHFLPGLHVCPIYSDSPSGLSGWKRGDFACEDRGDQSRLLEPSLYLRPDNSVVMIFRDQSSSFYVWASESMDGGQTWSTPAQTNMLDARTKQCAGNLTDSLIYLVGCPVGEKPRMPLVVSLSRDGRLFDRAYLLRSRTSRQPMRYEGWAKRDGFSYPKAMADDGKLYIVYTANKEDVVITVVSPKY